MKLADTFTPYVALEGGCLIALAALVFLVVANKRTGISGLLGSGLLKACKGEPLDRVASTFVGAFLLGALVAQQRLFPAAKAAPPAARLALPVYVLAGALTGFGAWVAYDGRLAGRYGCVHRWSLTDLLPSFHPHDLTHTGTRLGNGCTSGHGVCGLTRLSKRGLVAVCTFMAVGMAVANAIAQWPGGRSPVQAPAGGEWGGLAWDRPLDAWPALRRAVPASFPQQQQQQGPWTLGVAALGAVLLLWGLPGKLRRTPLVHLAAAASGALFAMGLQRSGMAEQAKVLGFLAFSAKSGWDPSLMVVLGAAVGLLLPPTLWVLGHMAHALGDPSAAIFTGRTPWQVSQAEKVDARLLVGEALFGVGWGLTGLCPGPALCLFAAGAPRVVLAFFPAYLLGWLMVDVVDRVKAGKGAKAM